MEIVESNWPDLLTRFVIEDALDVGFNASSEEIANLRKANINSILKLRSGRILSPPGGGRTSAGTSVAVQREMMARRKTLRDGEKTVRRFIEEHPERFTSSQQPEFALLLEGGKGYAVERKSGERIELF